MDSIHKLVLKNNSKKATGVYNSTRYRVTQFQGQLYETEYTRKWDVKFEDKTVKNLDVNFEDKTFKNLEERFEHKTFENLDVMFE